MRGARLRLASELADAIDPVARLESALRDAPDLDEVARRLLAGLTRLPGVYRVGLALSEVGGRRLRFAASDTVTDEAVTWCHIDAYDDVPLTAVVRTGEPIFRARARMEGRYASFVSHQPDDVEGFAVVPLPGTGSPIGGLILYLCEVWRPRSAEGRLLASIAEQAAHAVRRVRAVASEPDEHAHEAAAGERSDRLWLDDDSRSVALARRFLRRFLAGESVSADAVDTAELCLSELATNALMHAAGPFEVRLTFDDPLLTVTVRDRGQHETPVVAEPAATDDPLLVYGRGLQLVEALADRWGAGHDAHGSTTWFVLDVGSASTEATG